MMIAKWRMFVNEYFKQNMNATRAYQTVYGTEDYWSAAASASRLLKNVKVSEEIERRMKESQMSADEITKRLSDIARADIGDFLDITSMGSIVDLEKAREKGLTHLIKEVEQRTTTSIASDGTETEIHQTKLKLQDQLAALTTLGRYHNLEKSNLSDGININVVLKRDEDT